jgi:hypothetical protein
MSPQFIGSCHPVFPQGKDRCPGLRRKAMFFCHAKTRGLPTHPGLRPPLPDFREGLKTDPKDTKYESAIHRLMSPRPLYRRKTMFF